MLDFYKNLSVEQLVAMVPFGIACAAIGYTVRGFCEKMGGCCNDSIKKDQDKVVDTVDIEDIGKQKAFCRCWKSKKFPYCDGAHAKHNKETGDNVGPLLVKNANHEG